MKLLLDTRILLWALNDDSRLPSGARKLILEQKNIIFYSSASIWEVSIKHSIHPETIPYSGKELDMYCREAGYHELSVNSTHVFALETLSRSSDAPRHNDPFDRIMLAQAKAEDMRFVTHGHLIPYYNEPCIEYV